MVFVNHGAPTSLLRTESNWMKRLNELGVRISKDLEKGKTNPTHLPLKGVIVVSAHYESGSYSKGF